MRDRRPGGAPRRHRPRDLRRRPRRTCGRRSRPCAPYLARSADIVSVVKGLERGSAAADERGHRRGRRASPPARIAALSGPNLAAEVARNLPASAVVAAPDLELARARRRAARRAGGSGSTSTRTSSASSCRGAQERRGDRGRRGRRARVRRQRQGRAADARSGRDDAARDRGRGQPADVRRARRDGRPHRDVRVAAVAQPPARRGAREGPVLGRDRGDLPGTAEGAYTVQAALALADRLGVEMPIAREVERALFEGKSVQRCLVDLLARESKDELADASAWLAASAGPRVGGVGGGARRAGC